MAGKTEKLVETFKKIKNQQADSSDDEDEDSDDSDSEAPDLVKAKPKQNNQMVDDDGFEVVQ